MSSASKYDQIIQKLNESGVEYEVVEHEPVITSKEAEAVTGRSSNQGAKSILLKSKEEFILCVVKGSNRIDYKKLRKAIGSNKLRLATPDEVQEVMGVKIGACYPFGEVAGVKMYVDETLADNEEITFSPGVHDKHIVIKWKHYLQTHKNEVEIVDLKL